MKASVIIPVYNIKTLLEPCLLAFRYQSINCSDAFEVIVVDDGSTDDTEHMISDLNLNYTLKYFYIQRSQRSSRSAARNLGLQRATGDIVIYLDGDQIVRPYFIYEHLRYHHQQQKLIVVGFRRYLSPGQIDCDMLCSQFSIKALPPVAELEPRYKVTAVFSDNFSHLASAWYMAFSCNISMSRKALVDTGGFDANFVAWGLEDCELGYRLERHGLRCVYNPQAWVYDQYHPTIFDKEKQKGWHHNLKYFMNKYRTLEIDLLQILDTFPSSQKGISAIDIWFASYYKFEYALRAVQGRISPHNIFSNIRIVDASSVPTVEIVNKRADRTNLMLIDESGDGIRNDLDLAVQCIETEKDIYYFANHTEV